MGGQGLASFAAGLIGTLGGGLLEDRQTEQKKKDEELVRQLAAYHALLEHPDTPESEIPNIVDAQAKLLKAEKHFAPITAQMRAAMKRQVPYGPEQETAQSTVNRSAADASGVQGSTSEAANTMQMRPVAGVPTAPVSTAPVSVETSAVLPRVPEEPSMYQPTREYGTLTQGEAQDARKGELYANQQEEMTKRLLKVQGQAQDAAAEKERIRAEKAKELEDVKQKGRIAAIQKTFEEKTKILGPAQAAKIDAERIAYKNSLVATGMSDHDATTASYNLFRAQVDTDLANKKQKIEESKERVKRMGIQNVESFERVRKSKAGLAGAFGVSASMKREFDLRTGTLQDDLTHTLQLLDEAYKKAAGVSKGPYWEKSSEKAEIDRLEAKKDELWLGIDSVRNGLLNQSAPSVPGAPHSALDPALEQRIRDAATAKGLDPNVAVQRARARQ